MKEIQKTIPQKNKEDFGRYPQKHKQRNNHIGSIQSKLYWSFLNCTTEERKNLLSQTR